jgi:hypothetical protein
MKYQGASFVAGSVCLLAACASPGTPSPAPQDVHDNVKYSVIFGITPDADGTLQKCRFVQSSDPRSPSAAPAPFTPSDAYVKEGCDTLANGSWNVSRDADGTIKEVYMFCYYSTVIPDHPICDERFASKKK